MQTGSIIGLGSHSSLPSQPQPGRNGKLELPSFGGSRKVSTRSAAVFERLGGGKFYIGSGAADVTPTCSCVDFK